MHSEDSKFLYFIIQKLLALLRIVFAENFSKTVEYSRDNVVMWIIELLKKVLFEMKQNISRQQRIDICSEKFGHSENPIICSERSNEISFVLYIVRVL